MNRGFFVVFLGVVLGAMGLIFFNQASNPVEVTISPSQTPAATGELEVVTPPVPQAVAQAPSKPEPAAVPPTRPETMRPEPPKPETPKPEAPKPEAAKPEPAKPETPQPEPDKPVETKPEPAKPETPKLEQAKPQLAAPEPTPAVKPETPKPETPAPQADQTNKTLTLVNIGLHFKGNGMALRIESNAPFSYKAFTLSSPNRYVVDLAGSWNRMRVPTVPSNHIIKGARVGNQPGGPRLVLDMQRAPKKHSINWISPTILEILLE